MTFGYSGQMLAVGIVHCHDAKSLSLFFYPYLQHLCGLLLLNSSLCSVLLASLNESAKMVVFKQVS